VGIRECAADQEAFIIQNLDKLGEIVTTQELIKRLNEVDPDGTTEVSVGNVPIYFCASEPAYYDGYLQTLIQDHSKDPYYNIVGMRRTGQGRKVVLHTYSVQDYIIDDPEDAKIEYLEPYGERYREEDEKLRTLVLGMHLDIEQNDFYKWASGTLSALSPDATPEDFKVRCAQFYLRHRAVLEDLPDSDPKKEKHGDQVYTVHSSILERQISHWNNVVEFTTGWDPAMKIKGQE
jgi:hypothetical protein